MSDQTALSRQRVEAIKALLAENPALSIADIAGKLDLTKNQVTGLMNRNREIRAQFPAVREFTNPVPRSVYAETSTHADRVLVRKQEEERKLAKMRAAPRPVIAAPPPPEPPPPPSPAPAPHRVAKGACIFPMWDGPPTHVYCEKPTMPGKAYCPEHHAKCFIRPYARGAAAGPEQAEAA